mgnify:CR=1 FL=1
MFDISNIVIILIILIIFKHLFIFMLFSVVSWFNSIKKLNSSFILRVPIKG